MSGTVPGYTVLGLHVQNFKGIKVIGLRPKPIGVNRIMGDNHEGKSSLLDSVEVSLSGKAALPAEPIRLGAELARTVVEIGAVADDGRTVIGPVYQVKRVFRRDGDSELEVREAPVIGASKSLKSVPKPSPKKFLDALAGSRIGFDFFGYMRLDDEKQVKLLLDVMQLPEDPRELDKRRKTIFDERTIVNRDVKQAAAVLVTMEPVPEDTPDEEVNIADLVAELQALQVAQQANAEVRRQAEKAGEEAARVRQTAAERVTAAETEVERIKALLVDAEAELSEARGNQEAVDHEAAALLEEQAQRVAEIVEPDLGPVQDRINNVQAVNLAVRLKQDRAKQIAEVQRLEQDSAGLTAQIEQIDRGKAALFLQAKLPVPGLSIADDGAGGYRVTFNGVPVKQCSSSEQLSIGAEIALALNPKLRIALIREGSLLDEATLDWLDKLCQAKRLQALVEIVGQPNETEEGCFLIRAGELVEAKA